LSAHWTELPVVVAGRRALDQALRQWKHYADENRSFDHGRALGEAGMLEDRMYESCKAAAEGLEAAADDSAKAPDVESDRVRLQRVVGLLARWRERADRLQRMALEYEEEDDDKNAIDCSSAAQEIRDCALDIKEALAGKKPNGPGSAVEGPCAPRSAAAGGLPPARERSH